MKNLNQDEIGLNPESEDSFLPSDKLAIRATLHHTLIKMLLYNLIIHIIIIISFILYNLI